MKKSKWIQVGLTRWRYFLFVVGKNWKGKGKNVLIGLLQYCAGRMAIIGLLQGWPNHVWYTWLDRFLPGKTLMTVAKKIVADQLICSPISSASFFVGCGLLEGCSLTQCWQEYREKFLMVYLVSKDLSDSFLSTAGTWNFFVHFNPCNLYWFYRLIALCGLRVSSSTSYLCLPSIASSTSVF